MTLFKNRSGQLTLITLGLFLTVVGARLLLLKHFGTDLPQFDAWEIEGEDIYRPYFTGNLKLANFFAPCNEHRIAFTRFLSLFLLILNGLWDNRLQTVVNALVYSATGVILFRLIVRKLTCSLEVLVWAIAVAITFSLPYGWENALWGFQSQFYLLVAFSLAALYVACKDGQMPLGRLALLALLEIAALFTLASGLLVSVSVLCIISIVLIRNWSDRPARLRMAFQSVVSLAVVAFGFIVVYIPTVGRPTTITDFFTVLLQRLAWPSPTTYWCVVNWLPVVVLLVLYLKSKLQDTETARFSIALGLWVVFQIGAISFSRNNAAHISKYMDPIAIGMLANILALILLTRSASKYMRVGLLFFSVCWVAGNGKGLQGASNFAINHALPAKQEIFNIQMYKTKLFFGTGDIGAIFPTSKHSIPDRDDLKYAIRLTDSVINPILPRSVNYAYIMTGHPAASLSKLADRLIDASMYMLIAGTSVMSFCSIQTIISIFRRKRS